MACEDAQKILYGDYMLSEEVEYWWDNARQRFKANGTMINWVICHTPKLTLLLSHQDEPAYFLNS